MKLLAKLSVAFLILGAILFAIGNAMGGTVYSAWYNGRLHPWSEARNIGFFWLPDIGSLHHTIHENVHEIMHDVRDEVLDAVHDIPLLSSDLTNSNTGNNASAFSSHSVKNLELDLGCGTYIIQHGTEFSISGTGLEQIETWTDTNTWHVSYDNPHHPGGRHHEAEAAQRTVTITIPEDITFDEVELNAGMASVSLCALTSDKIDLNVGAANLATEPLTVNSLTAEVGAGSANLQLAERWENYHYELESGLGSITVNGESLVNEFAGESSGGHGTRELDLTVGMGKIQITTNENEV